MGQSYSILGKFIYKDDGEQFCWIVREEIMNHLNNRTAFFNLHRGSLFDPLGCLKVLLSEDVIENEDGSFECDFDGSYGWQGVMLNVFEEAFKGLEDNSVLHIYAWDEGGEEHIIHKQDGEICIEYRDY